MASDALSVFGRKKPLELLNQARDILRHQPPDPLLFNLIVSVDQNVALIDDRSPGDLWVCFLELGRDTAGSPDAAFSMSHR
jgi:hypothetical protein